MPDGRLPGLVRWLTMGALLLTACAPKPPALAPATVTLPATATPRPADSPEVRALWSWAVRDARSRSDIDQLVALLDRAHLNVILALVYYRGTAYFAPSRTRFSDHERLPNQSRFRDDEHADALGYLVALRDRRRADADPLNDFEVHAWFTVHSGGRTDNTQPAPAPDLTQPYMLNGLFPEFRLKLKPYYTDGDPRYIDHGVSVIQQPKFRWYMSSLIAGAVTDYRLDGAHLDYIRTGGICFNDEALDYPGAEFDYLGCQADYRAWTRATYGVAHDLMADTTPNGRIDDGGSGRVAAWLEHSVSLLVESIHREVKSAAPETILSAAVGVTPPEAERRRVSRNGQAAWEWLERGWLDAAFVMTYSADTRGNLQRLQAFREAVSDEAFRDRLFPGLATHDVAQPDVLWSGLLVEQVETATGRRTVGGFPFMPARGAALFVDRRFSSDAADALAAGPFRQRVQPAWGR